ncbi:hypothetical protein R1sor_008004 [Riccia sorocarpa]|uniref:DUF659 domain-containing protein n=1 Tax=Riccia sorocarpa TaxID=122646 RepID=A0ABD3HS54_9MARC
MDQFTVVRTHRNGVEVVCCKCKWCGNQYTPNVTRLTQHFTNEFAPRQRGAMEVAAYKKYGSNRHIKGCERATESLKFEIRGLNARHRGRMAEQNNSANEPSSSGNVRLTEEDCEIEQEFPGSILGDLAGTPSACFHNTANNVRAQHSNFSSPSSIANDSVHSSSQPFESLPPRTQPYIRRTVQLPLKPMMDAAQREKVDRLWAMAQQVAGLPFRVFSHPAFQEAYNFSSQFPGYKFPGEKKLRGPLLDANYQAVKEETEKKMFQKLIWDKITISCDGWTNVSGRLQMNILDVNRFGEAVHCHVDGSNEVKSGVWITGHIKKAIEERGPENVLQFVADNASANTLAGKLVRDTYPHVIFGGCVAHGLGLLMEDIGKLDWVKSVVTECKTFIQFVKNHHMSHTMFLDHFSNGATLLKPAATRFGTNCIMLDRAYTLKGSLSRMVISNRWRNWVSDPLRPANVREGADHLKTMVLDDEFWDKVHDIIFMMERIFILLRQVDAHKDFMGRIYWESWETQDALKHLYTASVLKSNILTAASCDQVMLLFRHRWNGWTNCIHTTAMLLNPAYLWDEDRQEVSHHNFIMEDFHEYVKLFATGVLKITGEELRQYIPSACERAWSSYGFVHSLARVRLSIPRQHKLVYIYHNARIKAINQKRERKTARVLNTYLKSRTQQSILKRRHGAEYGSTANPRDAWIPNEVLEAIGLEIGLSTGERVRIKTWDWTEPVSEDEVLDDKLQERNSRDNPQQDGQSESNVDPVENVVYYDDIGDHDFPDDSALQVEDPMVLPGMEIGEEDGLDDYYNISSNWIDQDSIARYTMVDAIDTRKARTLGVSENQVVELNKKFGNRLFPKVTLNVPGVTIMSKKLRILEEIYSMPVERTTTDRESQRPRASSRLKPTNTSAGSPTREDDRGLGRNVNPRSTDDSSLPRGETSLPTAEPSSPGGETSSPRADNSSPRTRTLRNQPLVDYRSQLNC